MAMPNHLVLVRHGESEGNYVRSMHRAGEEGVLSEEFRKRPGHEWRLTPKGVEQARAAGLWIQQHIIEGFGLPGFDRYFYSPHRRTRETAGSLQLPNAGWRQARLLREREWGELQHLVEEEHKEQYPTNYAWMKKDSLYWAPPGGESISQIADNRVREFYDTLHRDQAKGVESVVAVTHGEWMWADRLTLNYMTNEEYIAAEDDPSLKIHNCQVMHRTATNPNDPSDKAQYLKWWRSVWPYGNPGDAGEWQEAARPEFSNEELLAQADELPRL